MATWIRKTSICSNCTVELLFVSALLLVFANGCRKTGSTKPDFVNIAAIDGGDYIAHIHVKSLLKAHGIDSLVEGSIFYGVLVPKEDADPAKKILMDDAQERRYSVIFENEIVYVVRQDVWGKKLLMPKDVRGVEKIKLLKDDAKVRLYSAIIRKKKYLVYVVPEGTWENRIIKMPYDDVIQDPSYPESSEIGSVLRHVSVRESVAQFPSVVSIESLKREFMNYDGKLKTGYEVVVELASDPTKRIGGKRLRFQVWDGGKEIRILGGREWWYGDPKAIENDCTE